MRDVGMEDGGRQKGGIIDDCVQEKVSLPVVPMGCNGNFIHQ